MAGSFLSRRVDQPVRFHDRAGGSVAEGKLESVKVFLPDAGGREIVLAVWFDYWVFKRIDRAHLFGYTFESIDLADDQVFELTSTLPVQMELRVEGAARDLLAAVEGEELLDRAVAGLVGDDTSSPLQDAASYRYLGIYQQKEVAGSSFLSGFTSVYRKQP